MAALADATGSEEAISTASRVCGSSRGLATESDDVARRIDGAIEDSNT